MRGVLLFSGVLHDYLKTYCEFRDFVVEKLTVEFYSDSYPVVDFFTVGGVLLFEPEVSRDGSGYFVRFRPVVINDSPAENELLRFFENFVEVSVVREVFIGTMNFTGAECVRGEVVKRLKEISLAVTSGCTRPQ